MGFFKKLNPFSSQGTLGRAIGTMGMSVIPELLAKKALDITKPTDPGMPEAMPPPPNPEDAKTAAALSNAMSLERQARGRASTILSGGRGVQGAGLIAKRTLLGF